MLEFGLHCPPGVLAFKVREECGPLEELIHCRGVLDEAGEECCGEEFACCGFHCALDGELECGIVDLGDVEEGVISGITTKSETLK